MDREIAYIQKGDFRCKEVHAPEPYVHLIEWNSNGYFNIEVSPELSVLQNFSKFEII